jgi:hypothetical protein
MSYCLSFQTTGLPSFDIIDKPTKIYIFEADFISSLIFLFLSRTAEGTGPLTP